MSDKFEQMVVREVKRRRKSDLKEVIRCVLTCPTLSSDDVELVDGSKPIQEYLDANIDVMTRIVIRHALAAGNGDVKAAEFLMKYGAYTPTQEVSLNLVPVIVDDIPLPDTKKKVISIAASSSESEEEEMQPPKLIDITPGKDQ